MQLSQTPDSNFPEADLRFSWSRDSLAFFFFALALAAIYLPIALQGLSACSLPLINDVGFQWIPFKEFQVRSLRQGFRPLWTSHVFAGMPYLAFSHTGVLYPLGWILTFWDYARAVNWFYPLHLWIAAGGLYLLFRRLEISRPAAWLAGSSVVFTGVFYYGIHFQPTSSTITWSPWFLLGLLELARQGKLRHLALLILSLGLMILGGDVESTGYGFCFGFLFLLVLRWRHPHFSSLRPFALTIGIIIALLLILAQFLPLFEYSRHFLRAQGITFAYYRMREWPLALSQALFWPLSKAPGLGFFLDAPYFYLGLLLLFFVPLAILRRARPTSRPLALLAFTVLLFASGSFEPINRMLYHVPLFNKFHCSGRAFYLFQISLGLLAAQGLEHFFTLSRHDRRLTLLLLAGFFASLLGFGYLLRVVFLPGIHLVLIGLAGAVLLALFSPLRRTQTGLALILLFGFDTYAWAYRSCPRNDPKIFQLPQPLQRFAQQAKRNPGRYQAITRFGIKDPKLPHHLGFRLGLDSLGGYINLPPLRFAQLLNRIDPHAAAFKGGKLDRLNLDGYLRDRKSFDVQSWPLLDLLNLTYILDRHVPLKFASPIFLALLDPEHRVKFLPAPPRNQLEQSPPLSFRMRCPELISYRLYLEREDQLQLQLKTKQAQGLIFLKQSGMAHLLFARRGDSRKITIELTPWASQDTSLVFASVDAETREVVEWDSPAIVNRKRPLQEMRLSGNSEDGDQITIYRNTEALPRAFIAHEVEVIPDDKELLDRLTSLSRDHLR